MAATFKDFIIECELYPYSRENFEFMKECSELALTEKYIGDQVFLAEAKSQLSTDISLEENFFQESVDSSSIEVLTEKFQVKSGSLLSKMLVKIAKIYRTFAKFFARITGKFDPTTKSGQDVLSKLNSITFDDEKLAKVKSIVDGAKNNESSAFPVRVNQPFKKNIKLKYGGHEDIHGLRDDLAVALSNDKVLADVTLNKDRTNVDMNKILIMDPDVIVDAAMTLYSGKEAEIMNVAKTLANHWTHIRTKGLEIEVNTKSINKTAEQLSKVADKIVEIGNEINNAIPSMHGVAKSSIDQAKNFAAKAKEMKNKAGKENDVDSSSAKESNKDNESDAHNGGLTARGYSIESVVTEAGDAMEHIGGIAALVGKMAGDVKEGNVPEVADLTRTVNEFVSVITGAIGGTTRIYIQLNAYRQTVIKQLSDYLKTVK